MVELSMELLKCISAAIVPTLFNRLQMKDMLEVLHVKLIGCYVQNGRQRFRKLHWKLLNFPSANLNNIFTTKYADNYQ